MNLFAIIKCGGRESLRVLTMALDSHLLSHTTDPKAQPYITCESSVMTETDMRARQDTDVDISILFHRCLGPLVLNGFPYRPL